MFWPQIASNGTFFTKKILFCSQTPFANLDQELPETVHFSTTDLDLQDRVTRFPKFIEIK